MPIKEDLTILRDSCNTFPQYTANDMDILVEKLSHDLRLKARHKQQKYRSSPYSISKQCCYCHNSLSKIGTHCSTPVCRNYGKSEELTSPHKMLEELLKNGALIKEAVKRIELFKPRRPIRDSVESIPESVSSDEADETPFEFKRLRHNSFTEEGLDL